MLLIGMQCGIYKIINKTNGHYYVGSTNDFLGRCGRKYQHTYELSKGIHRNQHLQNAWTKYGADNFEFIFVESVDESNLLIVEQHYLDVAEKEQDKCYNKKFIAGGGAYGEVSQTTRMKQSKRKIGTANPRYNSRIYNLWHKETKKVFSGTLYEFVQMTNSCRKDVNKLLLWGRADSVKGWYPTDEDVKTKRALTKQPRKNNYIFTEEHRRKLRLNHPRKVTSSLNDIYTCKSGCTI